MWDLRYLTEIYQFSKQSFVINVTILILPNWTQNLVHLVTANVDSLWNGYVTWQEHAVKLVHLVLRIQFSGFSAILHERAPYVSKGDTTDFFGFFDSFANLGLALLIKVSLIEKSVYSSHNWVLGLPWFKFKLHSLIAEAILLKNGVTYKTNSHVIRFIVTLLILCIIIVMKIAGKLLRSFIESQKI